ncbi:MAG: efflux RND transporter periplasmic adaptor subunit [Flavobacterium sp.]|nr:efflux RND transporter periplasmic adaptor subunit [Flavobacterium sp.]
MQKKVYLLAVSIATLLASCSKESKKINPQANPIAVKIQQLVPENQTGFVSASGTIESENSANLSTRMMGYVTSVHAKVGQKVSKGQLLVSINTTDLLAKKAQVEAAILQANAAFNNAKKDYERFTTLFAQQSASQKEVDDMTSRYEMAKAGLEAAKQQRNEVQAQFSYANITAPFAGEVTNTFVKPGDMANPGMPLVSIEGAHHFQVTARVSESDISLITSGMKATAVVKSSQQSIPATVIEVSGSAKNTGSQYLVKLNLAQVPSSVRSGMFVHVVFPIAQKESTAASNPTKILVPKSALITQGQLTGIYILSDKNTAILRWLRIGKTYGSQVEVLSGLSANETYIVRAQGKLFTGAAVKVYDFN